MGYLTKKSLTNRGERKKERKRNKEEITKYKNE
jgi:hypothetical protein